VQEAPSVEVDRQISVPQLAASASVEVHKSFSSVLHLAERSLPTAHVLLPHFACCPLVHVPSSGGPAHDDGFPSDISHVVFPHFVCWPTVQTSRSGIPGPVGLVHLTPTNVATFSQLTPSPHLALSDGVHSLSSTPHAEGTPSVTTQSAVPHFAC
jgi:hypothetical protein